jgi:hypothetical protein
MKSLIRTFLIPAMVLSLAVLTSCGKKCDFGPEDWSHFIPKDTAQNWINRYWDKYHSHAGRIDSANLFLLGYADDFKHGKWMMGNMMCRDTVAGFRIYYGIKPSDSIVPILVGLTSSGNDVYWRKPIGSSAVATQVSTPTTYTEGAMDMSQKSPPPPMNATTTLFHEPF